MKLIKEAKRLQELAGINEVIKIKPPTTDIAKFLNNHNEEVEDKIIYPNAEFYELGEGINYDKWERVNIYDGKPDNEVNVAQSTIYGDDDDYIGINVSFEPFDTEFIDDDDIHEHPVTIGNRTVYIMTYDY